MADGFFIGKQPKNYPGGMSLSYYTQNKIFLLFSTIKSNPYNYCKKKIYVLFLQAKKSHSFNGLYLQPPGNG